MIDDESMSGANVFGAQQVDAEQLHMEQKVGLRQLLMGPPLNQRDHDETLTMLDSHLEAVAELLPSVYGTTEASQQAQMQFNQFLEMEHDFDGVLCKRAALLFALAKEEELGTFFAEQERHVQGDDGKPTFSEDMKNRVLPFILPRYIRNSCQTPDAFVVLANVLSELWAGEQLGNYPLQRESEGASSSAR